MPRGRPVPTGPASLPRTAATTARPRRGAGKRGAPSFACLGAATVWLAAGVIGAVAAVLPGCGVLVARHLAERTGERFARAAECVGGTVLIAIGVKALRAGG